MSNRVIIFDTTLRDGEQAGHKMPPEAKLNIAQKAAAMGVPVIEAGFPISSAGESHAVQMIARQVRGTTICALARAVKEDIETAARAIASAEHGRIHTFISTSPVHMEKKLGMTPEQVLVRTVEAVQWAKEFCQDVQFSPEDATRSEPEFLAQVVRMAIENGATVINIPDTVGYVQPEEFKSLLAFLYSQVPSLHDVILSVHCHDDLSLAVANSLVGVAAGARQVEGCWLGIGERAGNAKLEAVIAALKTRFDIYQLETGIDYSQIGPMCRKVSRLAGYPIPGHTPIVGDSAFAHSSGIHRDGVNKERTTYEIINPESYGWEGKSMELVSHLGRNGLRRVLDDLGYPGQELIADVYPLFEKLADAKGKLTEEDIHMIVQELRIKRDIARESLFDLEWSDYGPGHAVVQIRQNGSVQLGAGKGDGPVSSCFMAIIDALSKHGTDLSGLSLEDYNVVKGQGGPEAIAWTIVRIKLGDRFGYGRSGDIDTVKAAAKAFVYAINHLLHIPVYDREVEGGTS